MGASEVTKFVICCLSLILKSSQPSWLQYFFCSVLLVLQSDVYYTFCNCPTVFRDSHFLNCFSVFRTFLLTYIQGH